MPRDWKKDRYHVGMVHFYHGKPSKRVAMIDTNNPLTFSISLFEENWTEDQARIFVDQENAEWDAFLKSLKKKKRKPTMGAEYKKHDRYDVLNREGK